MAEENSPASLEIKEEGDAPNSDVKDPIINVAEKYEPSSDDEKDDSNFKEEDDNSSNENDDDAVENDSTPISSSENISGEPEEEDSKSDSSSSSLISSPDADFGYFTYEEDEGTPTPFNKTEAKRTCVLVVHPNFKSRKGNAEKVSKIEDTFEFNRDCQYVEVSSCVNREWIHSSLSSEDYLQSLFKNAEDDTPDVFILIILSLQLSNYGEIVLESSTGEQEYESINPSEIVGVLENVFRGSLKIVLFDTCQGSISDPAYLTLCRKFGGSDFTACQMIINPNQDNLVLAYANIDGDDDYFDTDTSMVHKFCDVLDNLSEDESLVSVLTRVQQKVHEESWKDPRGENAQTMEVVYTAHSKLTVYRCKYAQEEPTKRMDRFFSWKSKKGYDVQRRQAVVFCETKTDKVDQLLRVLKTGLDFEALCLPNTAESHNDFATAVSSGLCEYGCLLVCCFGVIEEKEGELHVRVGKDLVPIGKVVQKLVGPLDETWENRPKIAFFLQQDITSDHLRMKKRLADVTVASHNGWFIQVLPQRDGAEDLIQLLSNPSLAEGSTSLQELAVKLLFKYYNHQGDLIPKISTTLNYLLDFPKWPKDFVSPELSVVNLKKQKVRERSIELGELKDEFLQSYLQGNDRKYCVYLLSGEIGAGKSTILKELMSYFRKVDDCVVVDTQLSEEKLDDQFNFIQLRDFIDQNPARKISITDEALKSKAVIFVMQGFDSIGPAQQKVALNLMYIIAKNRLPLWIATRPKEEGVIIDKLKRFETLKVKIHPLNVAQQREMVKLKTEWTEKEIDKFLAFHGKTVVKTLLENPLHLSLLLNLSKSERYFKIGSGEINLYKFYEYIVKKHLSRCIEFPPGSKDFNQQLQVYTENFQIFALHGDSYLSNEIESNEEMVELEESGIMCIPGGNAKARYEHQTFKEFFIAQSSLKEKQHIYRVYNCESNQRIAEFIDKSFDANFCDALLKKKYFDNWLETIVQYGHVNIFNSLKPKITFQEHDDQTLRFISESDSILKAACVRSENLGMALLEMRALHVCKNEHIFLEEIARYGCLKLLDKFMGSIPFDIFKNLCAPAVVAAEFNRLEMLKVLLGKYKVDVNMICTKFGDTALQRASAEGHIECIKELLKHKADVDAVNREGKSALHLAAKNGQARAVRLLLKNNANPKLREALDGRNALYFAFLSGDLKTVQAFYLKKFKFAQKQMKHHFNEFLLMPIENRNAAICSFVIENSATSEDIFESGKFVMDSILPKGKEENNEGDFQFACKIFAKTSKFVQAGDSSGWTMLHKAAKEGNFQAVDCLLRSGAQIQGQTQEGYTPLHVVCLFTQDVKLLKFLIQEGACLVTVDGKMNNCLHLACTGANWNLLPVLLEEFKTYDLIDVPDMNGKTALHIAAMRKCTIEGFVEFFDKGADFYAEDNDNLEPLDYSRHFKGRIFSIRWHWENSKKTAKKRKAPDSSPSRSTRSCIYD